MNLPFIGVYLMFSINIQTGEGKVEVKYLLTGMSVERGFFYL
jgi:hypothetical protein